MLSLIALVGDLPRISSADASSVIFDQVGDVVAYRTVELINWQPQVSGFKVRFGFFVVFCSFVRTYRPHFAPLSALCALLCIYCSSVCVLMQEATVHAVDGTSLTLCLSDGSLQSSTFASLTDPRFVVKAPRENQHNGTPSADVVATAPATSTPTPSPVSSSAFANESAAVTSVTVPASASLSKPAAKPYHSSFYHKFSVAHTLLERKKQLLLAQLNGNGTDSTTGSS